MSNIGMLDRAANATMCQVLGSFGTGLVGAAAYPLWAPQGRLVALGAGSLMMLAANYACPEMDMGNAPEPSDQIEGCSQMEPGGYGQFQYQVDGTWTSVTRYEWFIKATSIDSVYIDRLPSSGKYTANASVTGIGGGSPYAVGEFDTELEARAVRFRIDPTVGSCAYDPDEPPPPPPKGIDNPIEYNDEVTNCTYIVKVLGFAQWHEGGAVEPVIQVEGVASTRNEGGRMGGCNFPPVIYIPNGGRGVGGGGGEGGGGGGGGGITFPVPDGGGPPSGGGNVPWWVPTAIAAAAGAGLGMVMGELMGGETQGEIDPATFEFVAPCDKTEEGLPENRTWYFDVPYILPRMVQHQVAIMQILQQHLNWKTPTCREQRPQKRGTWISTHWRSDADSPNSNRPLRKLFRYRSESTRTNDELQAYWSDFEWTSGNVCVIHKGAWWGTPQIWASTAEEGQRVIRRAGAEAGLDPDQAGEWVFSSSDSPRYGVSLKVRLAEEQGERWVTRREGASGFPEL